MCVWILNWLVNLQQSAVLAHKSALIAVARGKASLDIIAGRCTAVVGSADFHFGPLYVTGGNRPSCGANSPSAGVWDPEGLDSVEPKPRKRKEISDAQSVLQLDAKAFGASDTTIRKRRFKHNTTSDLRGLQLCSDRNDHYRWERQDLAPQQNR